MDRPVSIRTVENTTGNLALLPGPKGVPKYGTWFVLKESCVTLVQPGTRVHKYAVVVKDESHDMRNMKQTSKAVSYVAQSAYFSVLATATPNINKMGDIAVIAACLCVWLLCLAAWLAA